MCVAQERCYPRFVLLMTGVSLELFCSSIGNCVAEDLGCLGSVLPRISVAQDQDLRCGCVLPRVRIHVATALDPSCSRSLLRRIDVAQDQHCSRIVVLRLKVCSPQEIGALSLMIFRASDLFCSRSVMLGLRICVVHHPCCPRSVRFTLTICVAQGLRCSRCVFLMKCVAQDLSYS